MRWEASVASSPSTPHCRIFPQSPRCPKSPKRNRRNPSTPTSTSCLRTYLKAPNILLCRRTNSQTSLSGEDQNFQGSLPLMIYPHQKHLFLSCLSCPSALGLISSSPGIFALDSRHHPMAGRTVTGFAIRRRTSTSVAAGLPAIRDMSVAVRKSRTVEPMAFGRVQRPHAYVSTKINY